MNIKKKHNQTFKSKSEKLFLIKKINRTATSTAREKRLQKKRKFHKDSILKKIKSRFFKFFINNHMINFIDYINKQTLHPFKRKLVFRKIKDVFIKDVTIKRNSDWNFINKTPFQIFYEFSDMELDEVFDMFNNELKFNALIKNIGGLTEFVLFQPFKIVFNNLMSNQKSLTYMLEKVCNDLINKKHSNSTKEYYSSIFKSNITNFVEYFS